MSAILEKFPSFRLVLEFVKESSWCHHKYVPLFCLCCCLIRKSTSRIW